MEGQHEGGVFAHSVPTDFVAARPAEGQHWKLFNVIAAFILFDIFSIAGPGILISGLYVGQFWGGAEFSISVLLGVVSAILYGMTGAYTASALANPKRFVAARLGVIFCVWSMMMLVTFGLKRSGEFSRVWVFFWMFSSISVTGLMGLALSIVYRNTNALSLLQDKYVHIQTKQGFNHGADRLIFNRPCIILQRAVCDDVYGALFRIEEEIRLGNNIILSLSGPELNGLMSGLAKFRLSGIDMFLDVAVENSVVADIGTDFSRLPLVHIVRRPIGDFGVALKRLMDVLISSLLIAVLLPLLAVISLLILLEDGRPIFFNQPRRGYRHGVFEVWKFRTMKASAADVGAVRQATHGDERITRVGGLLRASCLDELPQLFNVLQGKMSLVGPRPHALQMTVEGIPVGDLVKEYASRHNIRPGMTGLAQVRGFRGPVHDLEHLQSRVKSDIEYIERWSPTLDLWILFKTISVVLSSASTRPARQKVG